MSPRGAVPSSIIVRAQRQAEWQRVAREARSAMAALAGVDRITPRHQFATIGRPLSLSEQRLYDQRSQPRLGLLTQTIREMSGPSIREFSAPLLRDVTSTNRMIDRSALRMVDRVIKPWEPPRSLRVLESMRESMREQQEFLARIYQFPPVPELRPRVAPVRRLPASDEVLDELVTEVETYLERRSAVALQRLRGARAAILRGDPESLAHAALSCRRTLEAVADVVYPPRRRVLVPSRVFGDLEISAQHYRNRLILFFETETISSSVRRLNIGQVDLLVALLKPLIEQAGKGVHDEIEPIEARRIYTFTLQLVAEIARHEAA